MCWYMTIVWTFEVTCVSCKPDFHSSDLIWYMWTIWSSLTAVGIRCADHVTPSTRKRQHYFAEGGGRSVGIVRLRTKATEFSFSFLCGLLCEECAMFSGLVMSCSASESGRQHGEYGSCSCAKGWVTFLSTVSFLPTAWARSYCSISYIATFLRSV
jgi:hypothetical protein